MIVKVRVVLKRTVVGDWRFDTGVSPSTVMFVLSLVNKFEQKLILKRTHIWWVPGYLQSVED